MSIKKFKVIKEILIKLNVSIEDKKAMLIVLNLNKINL